MFASFLGKMVGVKVVVRTRNLVSWMPKAIDIANPAINPNFQRKLQRKMPIVSSNVLCVICKRSCFEAYVSRAEGHDPVRNAETLIQILQLGYARIVKEDENLLVHVTKSWHCGV